MKLTVTLPTHSYDLLIEKGGLAKVGKWTASLWKPQKVAIITDETVFNLYGEQVETAIREEGFDVCTFVVAPGEMSKSLSSAGKLYESLADFGMTRKDGVIALGGGVVGDLTGFVASTYMRGLHFLQIPTTLLAQVDSSVGGKTAVNTKTAKNLIGTFAQPDGVLIDPLTLNTLEPRRIREGMAEIIKCAAIADRRLWGLLDTLSGEQDVLNHANELIFACCDIKRQVVEEDELDNGSRLTLNFGHTIGHAIEQTQGYGVVTHGEGVAMGMCQMSKKAEEKGLTQKGTTGRITDMLQKFNLPIALEKWEKDKLFSAISHDKKTRASEIKIIILDEIGVGKIETIAIDEMHDYLEKEEE
ncbi:3-dehydroquinate synthase [Vagococcus vulneris]|uniref:3-dehydroquinate synthase n=1 Tax=Vagococcus vulneris TaxID=1977869 RepID=A0A430A2P2_9ENTE|nr:3-dehydroquinate synthase [Vagococcus vulneris]RSU00710.1 3-dehydroquinate synthase [Vagococcus vulneris]